MASEYTITFAASARKEFRDLASELALRIHPRIGQLATNPRPPGCRKLKNAVNMWRIRVGNYRVVYSIDDRNKIVDIIRIRHRSEVYER